MHCDPRFCFVAHQDIEQHEAGDTLYHSFNVHPIPEYETLFFYLWGEIGGVLSNSTSPIMEYPLNVKDAFFNWYQRGYSDSGQAVTHNRARAMSFAPSPTQYATGVQLYIYGLQPALKLSAHIYATDALKAPTGSPLVSTYLAKIPYKRMWPDKGMFFIPFETVRLMEGVYYSLVIFGDPDSPDTTAMWWSRWAAPGDHPGQQAWWRQWTGVAWIWIKDTVSVSQYELWQQTSGATPCPSLPANITP